jgi:hypothetical protein
MAELIDQHLMVRVHIEAISKESDPQDPTSDPQQFPILRQRSFMHLKATHLKARAANHGAPRRPLNFPASF